MSSVKKPISTKQPKSYEEILKANFEKGQMASDEYQDAISSFRNNKNHHIYLI